MSDTLRLALTPGEPAGIGPDLCIQLAQSASGHELVTVADPDLLTERARLLGLPLSLRPFDPDQPPTPNQPGELTLHAVPLQGPSMPGTLNVANAAYVLKTLEHAVDLCLEDHCSALVTAPVHKGIINDAGIPFSGHTEFLAQRTGGHPVMMLSTGARPGVDRFDLRVALVTTHLPIKDVAEAITADVLKQVLHNLHGDLITRFGATDPHILVCGLNPHAGEGGHLGREELEVINPTLDELRSMGMNLTGPLPADTLFTPKYLEQADAVLAMYHDQGLPVLKFMGFGRAVNITLGLPIIRTSVDHGTALDLAGSGKAHVSSLQEALNTAVEMSQHSSNHPHGQDRLV